MVEDVADEAGLFAALGLSFIPPELREGLGEIDAAEKGELPRLLEPGDLRGAFHNHTTESDGWLTPQIQRRYHAMAGYDVLAITDHDRRTLEPRGGTTSC